MSISSGGWAGEVNDDWEEVNDDWEEVNGDWEEVNGDWEDELSRSKVALW
jgi:hypothetical protein